MCYELKSTGIIRRIDELGRIVIPKEIRRNLKIRDGENLEIYVEQNSIILKKHSKIKNFQSNLKKIIEIIDNLVTEKLIFTDRDKVLDTLNIDKNIINDYLSKKILNSIENRKCIISELPEKNIITNNYSCNGYNAFFPIISNGDIIGSLIIVDDNKIDNDKLLLLKFISLLISTNIDI